MRNCLILLGLLAATPAAAQVSREVARNYAGATQLLALDEKCKLLSGLDREALKATVALTDAQLSMSELFALTRELEGPTQKVRALDCADPQAASMRKSAGNAVNGEIATWLMRGDAAAAVLRSEGWASGLADLEPLMPKVSATLAKFPGLDLAGERQRFAPEARAILVTLCRARATTACPGENGVAVEVAKAWLAGTTAVARALNAGGPPRPSGR